MRNVNVTALVHTNSREAYQRLSNFAAYPDHMSSVRGVSVAEASEEGCLSSWEVAFREGTLKWLERDRFFPAQLRIDFDQVEGDLDVFRGRWQVNAAADDAAQITFDSTFDLGIPSLAAFLEPVAAEALVENISHVITGLFGDSAVIQAEISDAASDA